MSSTICAAIAATLVLRAAASAGVPQGENLKSLVEKTPRPFILVNEQELAALRQAVKVGGPKREMYMRPIGEGENEWAGAGVLSIANRWLNVDIRVPERGGHAHQFFCDCGVQLTLPADLEPRSHYTCPSCGRTYSGERYDAAVRCFHHHLLANVCQQLALAYAIEQVRKYSDKAADVLRKYAEVYPGPHTSTTEGGIIFQSLNEAMWVIPLAQAYDLIYDSGSLTDSDKRAIEDKLFRPAADGIRRCGTGGNWGSWHLSAVGVVGFAIRDVGMVDFAVKAFQAQIRDQLGDDGLWPESVHCYHFFPLQAFVFLAEAAERAGIDLYDWQAKPGKSLKSMFTAPLGYAYPNLQLPAINDGWYASYLPLNLYEVARHRWDDPALAWVVEDGYDMEAEAQKLVLDQSMSYLGGAPMYRFLLAPEKMSKVAAPKFASVNYSHFGLCTLRNDSTMITFHYGRFHGHGHPDKLSITLFSHDTLLAPDYGTPGYGSKILHWYQSTASHNTVMVDGKSQSRSSDNTIDMFYDGKLAQFAEVSGRDCYPGVSHRRSILLLGDICLIVDDLESGLEHDYDWLIHCEGFARMPAEHAPAQIDVSAYPEVEFSRAEQIGDGYRVDWANKNCSLALGIWSDGAAAAVGKCPAESEARRVSMLMCRQHASRTRFIAALAPIKPGTVCDIVRRDGMLEAKIGNAAYYFVTAGSAADLSTDAKIAAVRVEDGKADAAVLVQGSWLKWKGNMLIQRKSKVDCAEETL